jgi:tRNA threonylcarbamoyladenosine biosynthesis protein TsaB
MAVILSIETSTAVCSAALHENGNLLAAKELHTAQSAASQLAIQIEELLAVAKISKKPLQAVAVSAGPGSYTGLRIGVATAKGLCFGLNLPLIAIDSLSVLAAGVNDPSGTALLCPMIDARRMEVYCSLFDASMKTLEETQAKIIDENSFLDYLALHSVIFFGDGSAKCRSVIKHPNAIFLDNIYCDARSMGKAAFQKFQTGQFVNLALFEPNYLKNFIAKTKST